MKKILATLCVCLGLSLLAAAQPKSVGLRAPSLFMGSEVSYEHYLGGADNFLEAELGVHNFNGFRMTGLYNWSLYQPEFTDRGTWNLYAGPGITLGAVKYNDKTNFMLGITGQVGLEYRFWFPLEVSADIRPAISACDGEIWSDGYLGFIPSVSARFYF